MGRSHILLAVAGKIVGKVLARNPENIGAVGSGSRKGELPECEAKENEAFHDVRGEQFLLFPVLDLTKSHREKQIESTQLSVTREAPSLSPMKPEEEKDR